MAEALRKLVRERGTLKAFFTRFRAALDAIHSEDADSVLPITGRCKDKRFVNGLKRFNKIQIRIEQFDPSEQSPNHEVERAEFETTFYHLRSRVLKLLKDSNLLDDTILNLLGNSDNEDEDKQSQYSSLRSIMVGSHHESTHGDYQNHESRPASVDHDHSHLDSNLQRDLTPGIYAVQNNNLSAPISNQIKVPAISIPTFSGEYDEWLCFRDTFKSLIHNNHQISTIMQFHYLKGALKGEAALIIKAIEPSASN